MAKPDEGRPESPAERIRRMEANGTVTPIQAEQLRASLQPREDGNSSPLHAAFPLRRIAIVLAIVIVVGIAVSLARPGEPPAVQDVSSALNQPGGVAAMNQSTPRLIAIALLLIVPVLMWSVMHNSLVTKEEAVFEAWAQTESNYQRRADLMPALVESVSRYIRHESETLAGVTQERSPDDEKLAAAIDELIRAQRDAAEMQRQDAAELLEDEALLGQLYARQATVGRSMGHLFAVAEAYPELRSADQFLELQAQIEGTENRINVARQRFNDAVGAFNASLRRLPWNLVAGVGKFQRKAYFKAEEDARRAPELDFD